MDDVILVLGTGQMGPSIALSLALAGYPVILSGRSAERLARAARDMEAAATVMLENDLLTANEWHTARERIAAEVGYSAGARSTYVIEAIAEDLALKRDLSPAGPARTVPPARST